MGIKLPDMAKIVMIGQPYHGLWKGGSITLPNAETKTCPAPANGSCILLRVPGQPAVTRSEAEQEADALAGLEWRNYGLISGGRYGGIGKIHAEGGAAYVVLIDAAKARWVLSFAKNFNSSGNFAFSLRRFGHIDGTSATWETPVNVAFPASFWNSISGPYGLILVAQNTTGREFILGAINPDQEIKKMAKVSISGTVDLQGSGFGLSITTEVFGQAKTSTHTIVQVTGDASFTHTEHYFETDQYGTPLGPTYDRVRTYWLLHTENDTEDPPVYSQGWAYYGQSAATYSETCDMVREYSKEETVEYPFWVGYVEDTLVSMSLSFSSVDFQRRIGGWVGSLIPGYGGAHMWVRYEDSRVEHLRSMIGGSVVNDHSQSIIDDTDYPGGNGYCSTGMYDSVDDDSGLLDYSGDFQDLLRLAAEPIIEGGINKYKVVYLTPIPTREAGAAGHPVVVLEQRVFEYGTTNYVYTTFSAHAPSLAMETTSIARADIYATWHPVTDAIEVDTEPVCWF